MTMHAADHDTTPAHYPVTGDLIAGDPPFFRLACAIARRLRVGTLTIVTPDGRRLVFEGRDSAEPHAQLIVRDYAFARRTVLGGDIGFFESYADGQWETPDLAGTLHLFAANADHIADAFQAAPLVALFEKIRHALNRNTKSGSRRNIAAHYDLGNAFYEKWLDRTMTYSAARFEGDVKDLESAQAAKYRALVRAIDLKPGERVLEIGSGWGGFAEFAAKEVGANVTGVTISREQYDYARERLFRQGLSERAEIRLVDYRDVDGQYDKVASIEMFEAVGREYWPTYFARVRDRLKPGGVAGIQTITIADRMFDHYSRSVDFIQRYVFPGGMLPSLERLGDEAARAGLVWRGAVGFGADYARTLSEWSNRFLAAWDEIRPLGFDERFKTLWRFYLAYCEAGFRARTTDVYQVALSRP